LIEFAKDATVLVLSNRPISKKVIQACPDLRFIFIAFAGTDHVDSDACREKNIIVKNAAGYSNHAVAELTICLALNLYRKIAQATRNLCTSLAKAFPLGNELHGKNVGIIGGGAIGQETAKLFAAFGCRVQIFNRHPLELSFATQVSLDELLASSDLISLHIPLTAETKGLINSEKFALMKSSAVLINTARGPIVDATALLRALDEKQLAAAALDVFDQEPPLPSDHPLLKRDNVLATPHIGYRTEEAIALKAELAYNALLEWLA
jgi:D-3-phosphoglycerate dehydrogenase